MITLTNLSKHYHSGANAVVALNDISLSINAGEYVAVQGRSGSGKTTLVNMITALDHCTSGVVDIDGAAIHRYSEAKAAAWRGKMVGIVFQSFQLINSLSVLQNVTLPMDFARIGNLRTRRARALALLEQVDIVEHAHKFPTAVSGGQQQRVAIARALANDAPILIADEPTGSLDSVTAAAIFAIFSTLVAEGKTVLVMTHDRDLANIAHRTITLEDGIIIADSGTRQARE